MFDFNLSCGRVDHGSVRDRQKEGTTPVVVVNEDWPASGWSCLVFPGGEWKDCYLQLWMRTLAYPFLEAN